MASFTRARYAGLVAAAFVGGVAIASAVDITGLGYAQSRVSQPTQAEVRPLMEAGQAFTAIAESVTPAVVSIQAERDPRSRSSQGTPRRLAVPPGLEDFFNQFDPRTQQRPQESSGSGFIVSRDGHILTNNHVVDGADRLTVTLTDHRVFKARIIGRDPTTDIAVIKIEGNNLPVAVLGDDTRARVGEWVVAIGNPLGLDFTVTAGIISAKGRGGADLQGLSRNNNYAISDFIQTDAAINPGNSGGPLVNINGEVIGVNSAIASGTGYYSGYGFAIPITLAKMVMEDIIRHGRVRRPVLGVAIGEVSPEDAAVAGLKEIRGVKVGSFTDDSPAKRAGIEPGDIIVKAAGQDVDRVSTLQRIVRRHALGETIDIEAMRYGQRKSFRVKLAEAPAEEAVARAEAGDREREGGTSAEKLGVTLETLTAEFAQENRIGADRRGVRVVDVTPGGPARGKLIPSDIIFEVIYPERTPVRSVADVQRVLAKLKDGDYISLNVFQPNGQSTRVVNLRIGG
jgi:serine protease Do